MKALRSTSLLLILCLTFAVVNPAAYGQSSSANGLVYHGRILKADGQPLEESGLRFVLSVYGRNLAQGKRCLLFQEEQTNINLIGTSGTFELHIGEGTRLMPATLPGGLSRVFLNSPSYAQGSVTCDDSSTSYTSDALDRDRELEVSIQTSSGVLNLPTQKIRAVPWAMQAMEIGGYSSEYLLKLDQPMSQQFPTVGMQFLRNAVQISGGVATGRLIGLTDPVNPQDVATKAYVDSVVGGGSYTAGNGVSITSSVIATRIDNTTIEFDGSGVMRVRDAGISTAKLADGSVTAAKLNQMAATTGQVLKWNGSAWAPAADTDTNTVVTAGNGLSELAGAFDINADGTSLEISSDTLRVKDAGITAAKLNQMGATTGQVLKWNGSAWAPAADTDTDTNTTYTASAPLTLTAGAFGLQSCSSGEILKWNGTAWACSSDATGSAPADATTSTKGIVQIGTGINVAAGVISANFGTTAGTIAQGNDSRFTDSRTPTGSAGGALAGTYPNPTLAQAGATTGQVLKWNGSAWAPAADTDTNTTYTAGTGIDVTAGVISANFGTAAGTIAQGNDSRFTDSRTPTGAAGGSLSGTYPNPGIAANAVGTTELAMASVTAAKLHQMGATTGQVLKWNGSAWAPDSDATGGVPADATTSTKGIMQVGTGLGVTSGVVSVTYGTTAGTAVVGNDSRLSDARTPTGAAGGDLTGTYPNPTLAAGVVDTTELANGAVTAAKLNQMAATTGQVLKWNGSAWAPAADTDTDTNTVVTAGNGLSETLGAFDINADGVSLEVSSDTLRVKDAGITAAKLNQMGATSGQVLKWNGSAWAPDSDATGGVPADATTSTKGIVQIGTGINVAAGVISANFGTTAGTIAQGNDSRFTDSRTPTGAAGGALAGTYPNPTLAQAGATTGQVLKWNGTAWAPAADTDTDTNTTYTASAPLTLTAGAFGLQACSSGEILKWNGSAWACSSDATGGVPADATTSTKGIMQVGTGLGVASGVVSVTYGTTAGTAVVGNDSRLSDARTPTGSAGGDLTGTYPNPTVANAAITAAKLHQMGATSGQVLKWNGSAWAPAADTDTNTVYTDGNGLSLNINALDINTDNTSLEVSSDTLRVKDGGITAAKLNQMSATSGQVLKWNGSAWAPAVDTDTNTTYTAGGPLTLTAGTFNLQSCSSGEILKWNGSAWACSSDATGGVPADATTSTKGIMQVGTGLGVASGVVSVTYGTTAGTAVVGNDSRLSDARTPTGSAGGDLTGTYPNPTLAAGVVDTTELANGAVTAAKLNQMSATSGQVLKWNGSAWAPATDTDTNTTYSAGGPLTLTAGTFNLQSCSSGEILKWNGSAWACSSDATGGVPADATTSTKGIVQIGTGINVAAGVISANFGTAAGTIAQGNDSRFTDSRTPTGAAGGALAGTYPNPTLAQAGATSGQVLKWNGTSWAPAADTDTNTVVTAGDGLSQVATAFNVNVDGATIETNSGILRVKDGGITAAKLNQMSATSGQVLKWNGTAWAPAADATGAAPGDATTSTKGIMQVGTGLNVASGVVSVAYGTTASTAAAGNDSRLSDARTPTGAAGGALAGTYPNPTLAQAGATSGQVLKWNGTAWAPAADTDTNTTYTANGPLTLSAGAFGLQSCSSGEILKWNGSAWACSSDATGGAPADATTSTKGIVQIGTGINVAAGVISANFGTAAGTIAQGNDSRFTDSRTPTGAAGGDLTGTYPNPTVANAAITAAKLHQMGATSGQVLKWNGSAWAPAADTDTNTAYTAGTGIGIASNVISVTYGTTAGTAAQGNDSRLSDARTPTGSAGGDLTGTYPNPTLAAGVVDTTELANGAVTAAKLNQMSATSGQVLKWNGTAWAPAADTDTNTTYTAGGPLTLTAGTFNLQSCSSGEILKWNGSAWACSSDATGGAPADATTSTKGIMQVGTGLGVASGVVSVAYGTTAGTAVVGNDARLSDARTPTGSAGGALAGTYPNPTLAAGVVGTTELAAAAVTAAKLHQMGATTGQVLKWNGTAWAPAADTDTDTNTTYTAGTGIGIASNVISVTYGTTASTAAAGNDSRLSDARTPTGAAGGALAGTYPNPTLAQAGATSGQVLKWNGTSWAPAADTAYTEGNGLSLNINALDINTDNTSLEVSSDTLRVKDGGITAAKLNQMSATSGQVLKWNGSAWAPAADATGAAPGDATTSAKGIMQVGTGLNVASGVVSVAYGTTASTAAAGNDSRLSDARTPTGAAGGALAGTYPNPTLAQAGATTGQVLKWNGSAWAPAADTDTDTNTTYTAGTGIGIASNVISVTYGTTASTAAAGNDARLSDARTPTGAAGGALAGTYPNPTLAQAGATTGQVLKWSGSAWAPAADTDIYYTEGNGLSLNINSFDVNTDNTSLEVSSDTVRVKDLGISTAKLAAGSVTAAKLNQMSATTGQVLKWNGSAWAPAADDNTNTTYTAGTGIGIASNVISVTYGTTAGTAAQGNDSRLSDARTPTGAAGGSLSGTYPNPILAAGVVGTTELAAASVTAAKLNQMSATTGQVLKWNGSAWAPAADNDSSTLTGTGTANRSVRWSSSTALNAGGISDASDAVAITINASENVTFTNQTTATAYYLTSDRRLKTDIHQIDDGLATILALRGVHFRWIKNGEKEIGLIAQEVEEIYPELVKTDENGRKSVKYSNLVAPLIESTRDLYNMSKMQESQMTRLQERLASIEEKQQQAERNIASVQSKVSDLEKENVVLKNENKKLRTDVKQMKQELEIIKRKLGL